MKYDPTTGKYSPDDPETAKKKARRQTRANQKREPLFAWADLTETITAEQVIAEQQKFLDEFDAHSRETARQAEELRQKVIAVVSPAVFAELCEDRKIYPPSPEYSWSHWFNCLVKYAPAIAQEECMHGRDVRNGHGTGHDSLRRMGLTQCPACHKILGDKINV